MSQKEFEKFIILLTSANSTTRPLTELEVEFKEIHEIISDFDASKNHPIHLKPYERVNLESLSKALSRYLEFLYIFHFSGHANEAILQMEDKNADGQSLAEIFELAINLKLVFLNGCATEGHVKSLLKSNIPAIIATTEKVGDRTASKFSTLFYEEFVSNGRRLEEAFSLAKQRFNLDPEIKREDIAIRDTADGFWDNSFDSLPWGLYLNSLYERSQILDWQIGKTYPFSKIAQQTSNKMLHPSPRSPYIVGSPIKEPERFFGRDDILSYVLEKKSLQLCILGIRRIGKTSLLRQLEAQYATENQNIAIYLNLQSLKTPEDIGRELKRSIQRLTFQYPLINNFYPQQEHLHINKILLQWAEFCNKQRFTSFLLLDEAEELANLSSQELADFRALFDREPSLSLIITGSRFLRELTINEQTQTPFLNTLEVIILSTFSEKESANLITQNDKVLVDINTLKVIQQLSGQHPFLIQYIAHKLYQNGKLEQISLTSDVSTLSKDLSLILKDEFSRLTSSEKWILRELSFSEATSLQMLQQNPNIQQNELRLDLKELEELGFIRCSENQYFLNNVFWKQYLDATQPDNIQSQQPIVSSATLSKVITEKTEPQHPTIYISHYKTDNKYLEKLKIHLTTTKATLRDSHSFSFGSEIDQSLEATLGQASIIVLLLSQEYLIHPEKIAERNLIKSLKNQGKRVIPILVKPCSWEEEFGNIQILPQDREPLSKRKNDLDHSLTTIAKIISTLLTKS